MPTTCASARTRSGRTSSRRSSAGSGSREPCSRRPVPTPLSGSSNDTAHGYGASLIDHSLKLQLQNVCMLYFFFSWSDPWRTDSPAQVNLFVDHSEVMNLERLRGLDVRRSVRPLLPSPFFLM
uniref:Uncharacterized protein n=1 Tax=Aegilops tauschii subsp. strangulata TaxID=200361 RepID=A0A453SUX9_AEGTS